MDFFLVDVKSITPSKPVEQFDKAEVEKLADSILECNGLIKPLVLKPAGPESYAVIEGDMEFHAAVRAREKDPRKCEMVNAFVISPKAEEIVLNQLQTLQNPVLTPPSDHAIKPTENLSVQKEFDDIRRKVDKIGEKEETVLNLLKLLIGRESGGDVTNLLNKIELVNQKIVNLENIFNQKADQQQTEFQQFFEQLQQRTADIETIFNRKFEEQKVAFQQLSDSIKGLKETSEPIPPEPVVQAFLDFLNSKEKSDLRKIDGISDKTAETIINNRPYNSMEKLSNVKMSGSKFGSKTVKWLKSFNEKKL